MAVMQKMLHCGRLSNLALTQQFENETGLKKWMPCAIAARRNCVRCLYGFDYGLKYGMKV